MLLADATTDIIGAAVGVIGVAFGLWQRFEAVQARRDATELRDRGQAERITAWAEKRTGDARVVVVSNGSDRPIYDVSAWLVPADYVGDGVPDKNRTTGTAVLGDGADHEYSVATTGGPPAQRPRVLVAFEDADGRKWLRKADRQLVRR